MAGNKNGNLICNIKRNIISSSKIPIHLRYLRETSIRIFSRRYRRSRRFFSIIAENAIAFSETQRLFTFLKIDELIFSELKFTRIPSFLFASFK